MVTPIAYLIGLEQLLCLKPKVGRSAALSSS
jgi:hypothetical protein